MARDMRYLGKSMRKVAIAIEQDVNELVKDIAVQVQHFVAYETPVDVGTARSNWVLRVGRAFTFRYRAFAPGNFLGRSETSNLAAVGRQGAAAAASRKTDQPIYITNNLPYIGRLNSGYSPQSAAGFVRRGIASGTRYAVQRFRFRNVQRLI